MPLDPNNHNQFIVYLIMFKEVILGVVGGLVAYLFDYSKAKRSGDKFEFSVGSMLINMALGAFVAYLVGTVVPVDMLYRDAIVGVSGVTAYQILLITESNFPKWLASKVPSGKEK